MHKVKLQVTELADVTASRNSRKLRLPSSFFHLFLVCAHTLVMVRLKHRYLLCEVKWEKEASKLNISTYILLTAIRENLVSLFGEFGLACVLFSLQGNI